MQDKMNEALNEISDRHIAEAARRPAKKRRWLGAIAAVLAVAILVGVFTGPGAIRAEALTLAGDPRVTQRPNSDDYKNLDEWRAELAAWQAAQDSRLATKREALEAMKPFLESGSFQFLSGSTENRLWSPANAYVGLAALSELTAGNSRQQILTALGVTNMVSLRSQVSAVWESAYLDGKEASQIATSLWLNKGLNTDSATLNNLSYYHYASVYRGKLGSDAVNKDIGSWLNKNTGGLLKSAADNIRLPEDAVLALYSTLYFQSKWIDEFKAANNTDGVFHAPGGDTDATYMNKKLAMMYYYWGDNFGAVALNLKNGSQMWFILPDAGKTVDDVLANGSYLDMILPGQWENQKYMKVNLSVPKFDVSGSQNLKDGLMKMGVNDVFSKTAANFSAITADVPVYLTGANQSVRVEIDEQGVKAAAYIEFPGAMSPAPPDEIIDFVLDRPFLFVITKDRIPLFAGTVNQP